jgi:uncharacterized membrane protein YhaH (DUF805 family)
MTFVDAVKTCFSKYADFEGCASRSEVWWWVLFTLLASLALDTVSKGMSGVFSLATLLPGIAVTARRLHDTDRSGWLQLLWLVPVIGWIFVLVWCIQDTKPNRYGGLPLGSTPTL